MKRLYFTVHNFQHALAVLIQSKTDNVFPVLITAPQVISCMGASAGVALIDEAGKKAGIHPSGFEVIFDVQEHIGAAIALLQQKHKISVFIETKDDVFNRLNDLAKKNKNTVIRQLPTENLDLSLHFHLQSACRDYIMQQKRL